MEIVRIRYGGLGVRRRIGSKVWDVDCSDVSRGPFLWTGSFKMVFGPADDAQIV